MSDIDALKPISCPNCHQPMRAQNLEQVYHGAVRVDLCFTCAGIWFSHWASGELAPGAVIELFKQIQADHNPAHQPVAERMLCPSCRVPLTLSYDLSKTGRFSYYRCPRGDGRFTPFFQFLREKQFVRSLTTLELQRLRSTVQQIKCSACGAPIDLENSTECRYCHAPVSFLDPKAVEQALHMWSEAENRQSPALNPAGVGNGPQRIQLPQRYTSSTSGSDPVAHLLADADAQGKGGALDLVATGIRAIARLFEQ